MTEQEKTNLSDEELVVLVRESDKELYSEIIRRYKEKLLRYLRKFISDPDERNDVLQDVFIKAYKNLYGFNTGLKFSSWLYRIAHNEAVNSLRKNTRTEILLDDVEYKLIRTDIDIEGDIDKKITKKHLIEALRNVDLRYREPLMLFYFDDRSYEEISDILRIPKNTVGTYISRGKQVLKYNLEKKV
ncbi:MAG: RNA polymerase sigma factor [bacterium]